jgi:hypothetical protein
MGMIALMMEAASTSETSVNLYHTTQCNILAVSQLHIRQYKNLKSQLDDINFILTVYWLFCSTLFVADIARKVLRLF